MPNAFTNFLDWLMWRSGSEAVMKRRCELSDRISRIGKYLEENIDDYSFTLKYKECYISVIDIVAQVGKEDSDRLFTFVDKSKKEHVADKFGKWNKVFYCSLIEIGYGGMINENPLYAYISQGEEFSVMLLATKECIERNIKNIFSVGLSIFIYCLRSDHVKISSKNLVRIESLVGGLESRIWA